MGGCRQREIGQRLERPSRSISGWDTAAALLQIWLAAFGAAALLRAIVGRMAVRYPVVVPSPVPTEANTETVRRKDDFVDTVHRFQRKAQRRANWYRILAGSSLIVSILLFGLASLAGILAEAPIVKSNYPVQPWAISALTALAAGVEIFRNRMGWRKKAYAYALQAGVLEDIALRIGFEYDQRGLLAALIRLSQEFRDSQRHHNQRIQNIENGLDDRHTGGSGA